MTRVLSGAALIALAVGVVWFAPDSVFQLVAAVLVALSVRELVVLAGASDLRVSMFPVLIATLLTAGAVGMAVGLRARCGADGRPRRDRAGRARIVARRARTRWPTVSAALFPAALHRPADRRARRGAHVRRTARAVSADADGHGQRHGAVLHGPGVRPAAAGAGDQPEEDHRGRDRRVRLRHRAVRRRRRLVGARACR